MFGEQQQGLARKSDAAVNVEGRVGQPSQIAESEILEAVPV